MILYSVTIVIQADIESEWVDWMKKVHVPDVLRTGFFSDCQICKLIGTGKEEPTYILQYRCPSLEEYYRYRDYDDSRRYQRDESQDLRRYQRDEGQDLRRRRSLLRLRLGAGLGLL